MVTPNQLRERTSPQRPSKGRTLLQLAVLVAVVMGLSQAWSRWHHRQFAQTIQTAAVDGDIVMYSTVTCPYCKEARQWLASHDVPFRECFVDEDAQCQAAFERQGAPGVPMFNVKGQWRVGFDPQWISRVLGPASGQPKPPAQTSALSERTLSPGFTGPALPDRPAPL